MTIRLECRCGARLKVDGRLAGKKGKCPECGETLRIPEPATKIADSHGEPCPECGEAMSPQAILCIHCGYHSKHGQQLETEYVRPPKPRLINRIVGWYRGLPWLIRANVVALTVMLLSHLVSPLNAISALLILASGAFMFFTGIHMSGKRRHEIKTKTREDWGFFAGSVFQSIWVIRNRDKCRESMLEECVGMIAVLASAFGVLYAMYGR